MGTVDGPEFCSCLTLFPIESVGFLVSSPSKYATWNLRCHIYISRNNYGTNVTEEPLLQLKAVHSFWCVNEDPVWFCVICVCAATAVGVSRVDFKMRTTSMYELPQLQKGCFSSSDSMIISASVCEL